MCDDLSNLYFEKQYKLMCGLHSINNLFGYKIATTQSFIKVAENIIRNVYDSAPRRIPFETYRSNVQPNYYDCERGFFSPDIQQTFINSFTDYTLKSIPNKHVTDKDIIKMVKQNQNIEGFLLSVSKKFKTSRKRYNHSIAIRVINIYNIDKREVCVILLDSELDGPVLITKDTTYFTPPNKLYSINTIQKFIKKSNVDIEKQAQTLIIDLTQPNNINQNSPEFNTILKSIQKSPNLMKSIKTQSFIN